MGHIPNENVDDIVPELGVEGNQVLPEPVLHDNFLNENMNQVFLPANNLNPPPPLNLEWNLHRPAAIAHPEPHIPRRRMVRPPPIGISIPINHRTHEVSANEFLLEVWCRGNCLPLRCNNRVLNRPNADRRRRVRKNNSPPTMPQLRFQNPPWTREGLDTLSPQRRHNRSPRSKPVTSLPCNHHPRGDRPQSFQLTTHKRLRQSRLRRCRCKMNRADFEVSLDNVHEVFEEEEEDDDDDDDHDYKCNACEAYKDLHYHNDTDDDDYSDDNNLPTCNTYVEYKYVNYS